MQKIIALVAESPPSPLDQLDQVWSTLRSAGRELSFLQNPGLRLRLVRSRSRVARQGVRSVRHCYTSAYMMLQRRGLLCSGTRQVRNCTPDAAYQLRWNCKTASCNWLVLIPTCSQNAHAPAHLMPKGQPQKANMKCFRRSLVLRARPAWSTQSDLEDLGDHLVVCAHA
jgi:hypothetical protein